MDSGLCDILGQNAGIAFQVMLNVHHLLLALEKNSRAFFFKRITIHIEHTQALYFHLLNSIKS